MNFENKIIERVCPSCNKIDAKLLFSLSKHQFVLNNPTYNLTWFESLEIPDSFQFPFVQCKECNFVYSQFRLNEEYNFSFYNEGILLEESKKKIFKRSKRVFQAELWRNLLSYSTDKPELKVLDYGGGWGDFLSMARSYGTTVVGLEFDQRKIDFAKSHDIVMGDLAFIEQHGPYDIFMCNQVMEHLDDPKSALLHLRSLLSPDAVGFIGVPNFNAEYLQQNIKLINSGGIPPKEINPFGHLNYFSPTSFLKMLQAAGFERIQTKAPGKRTGINSIFSKAPRDANDSTMLYVRAV